MTRTVVPFGPQHPVLPEPIHLTLYTEDEIVKEAVPALGYVHRGLEKLAEVRDHNQMIQIVERVCGICSMIHSACYCSAVEKIMGVEVPPRANYLRVIWSELHRMHSHLLWLGCYADAFGFESLFMHAWRIRERVMDVMEATAGNRVIISVNVIGGVRRDLSPEQQKWVLEQVAWVESEVKRLRDVVMKDYTVKKRTVGVAVLTAEKALELGAAGPMLRGSGVAQDMRMTGYHAYGDLGFEPVTEPDGDCYARCNVRFRETLASAELVRRAIAKLPDSELAVTVKGRPKGETIMRVEQPRGELLYYVKSSGGKYLDRVRIRTPTFANIAPLCAVLPGLELADIPVIVLSIDPCISCTER